MRVFVALPLPAATANGLAAALEPLRAARRDLRWVNAAGYHVTLHFFGDVEGSALDALTAALQDPRLRRPSVPARLGAIGQFPARGAPRVVWAALAEGSEQGRQCFEAVQSVIAPLGWTPDPRGFTPHVTVARSGREPAQPLADLPPLPGERFTFDEIVLFESLLGPGGAVYTPRLRIPLDGRAA